MSRNKQKLELTWIGKEKHPRLEPRILLEDPEKSSHAQERVSENDFFDNKLIFGDNLLALKALETDFAAKIKCIYIDPPFNTGQAFEHYEDGLEHSIWLSLMKQRLELLHTLLHSEGTIFIHIDDNELAYLMAICDEIFGRSNRCFIATFKQGSATGHKAINPGCVNTTNFILAYCKDKNSWSPNKVFTPRGERNTRYDNFIVNRDKDFSEWEIITLNQAFADHHGVPVRSAKKEIKDYDEKLDEFVLKNAKAVVQIAYPNYDAVSAAAREKIDESKNDPENIYYLERDGFSDFYLINGKRLLFYYDRLQNIDGEMVAAEPLTTLWDDLLSNNLHKEGQVSFPKGKKPEGLIKRVLELSTNEGDWVLDSFAGSGTTGAVAHKMRRKWIMVELGDHCDTHVAPRLTRVIDNKDTSGITKVVNWEGGGGFRYYRLAPSMLEKDKWGNWVISKDYNAGMLTEAMCKHMGFTYAPDESHYWMHGHSTETDFIYVTTSSLTHEQLRAISEEVGPNRTLLICCKAFNANAEAFDNLTLKKIPQAVLTKCEWGKDDYSLNVAKLQPAESNDQAEPDLFEEESEEA
jgi:adenine-specific DNA-methyltransferase